VRVINRHTTSPGWPYGELGTSYWDGNTVIESESCETTVAFSQHAEVASWGSMFIHRAPSPPLRVYASCCSCTTPRNPIALRPPCGMRAPRVSCLLVSLSVTPSQRPAAQHSLARTLRFPASRIRRCQGQSARLLHPAFGFLAHALAPADIARKRHVHILEEEPSSLTPIPGCLTKRTMAGKTRPKGVARVRPPQGALPRPRLLHVRSLALRSPIWSSNLNA
jgi:hypothetical protein